MVFPHASAGATVQAAISGGKFMGMLHALVKKIPCAVLTARLTARLTGSKANISAAGRPHGEL